MPEPALQSTQFNTAPVPPPLVSRHGSDVVGCAQPSERSARRIAHPIPSVLASDATPRCAPMASADRQMIGDATLEQQAPDLATRLPQAGAEMPGLLVISREPCALARRSAARH